VFSAETQNGRPLCAGIIRAGELRFQRLKEVSR
jgi:hypothetical protein